MTVPAGDQTCIHGVYTKMPCGACQAEAEGAVVATGAWITALVLTLAALAAVLLARRSGG